MREHVKVSNKSFVVPLGASGLGEIAVKNCNFNAEALAHNGMSLHTIFNSDRDMKMNVAVHFAARVQYKNLIDEHDDSGNGDLPYWHQATAWTTMPVRCLKSLPNIAAPKDPTPIPAGPQIFKMNVGVNQAVLTMTPKDYSGACPMDMNASGVIVTNGKTAVKYRFESDKGVLSPIYTVQVDQTHTAYVISKFRIGVNKDGPASTFAAPSGPPSAGQGPKLLATPTQANVHQGFYRLHIVAPNQLVSAPSDYKVTCTQYYTGPAGSAPPPNPQPAPVKPPALGVQPAKPGVAPAAKQIIKQVK